MIQELGKNRYRFVVSVGSGKNRRRPQKTITFKGGKKELQKLHDAFEEDCKNLKPVADITVKELLEAYITHCKVLGRKAETIRGYETAARRFYKPVGAISAKDCTIYRLEACVAEMADNGLASKTIKNSLGVLSAAYDHAISIDQLSVNPCKRVKAPRAEQSDKRILYEDELPAFIQAIQTIDLNEKVAYELALFLGLRRSEIIGIREQDVDIAHGKIWIHNTRHRVHGVDIEQDTKTEQSTKSLALSSVLIGDIAQLIEQHKAFPYRQTDLLIQNGAGEPLGGQALASRLTRFEKRNHLPHVTLHGLRHTYASMLNASGVDMAMISTALRHSNITTTANIYTHVFKEPSRISRQIADVIDGIEAKSGRNVADETAIKNP